MRKRIFKTDKSEMSYQQAIELVALNESPGDTEALKLWHVEGLVGVCLVADIFGVSAEKFAKEVIKFRRNHPT